MTKNFNLVQRSNKRVSRKPRTKSGSYDEQPSNGDTNSDTNEEPSTSSKKTIKGAKLYHSDANHDRAWTPTVSTVFKVLVSLRISSALWCPLSDCDEVYNYWEPLHLFLYKSGFQTWEYSPVYAIRSYLYIWLHVLLVKPFQFLLPHTKVTTFFFVRCALAFLSAASDLYLYSAVRDRLSNAVARYQITFSAAAAGMFIASSAFLPSSFSMSLNALAVAAYLKRQHLVSIMCTAVSALIGWPFAAVLGLPVMAQMTLEQQRQPIRFVLYALMCGIPICALMVAFDSHYFGRTALAPLNIVLYNMFTSHGPNLYGTEPLSYYVINLLLNWNVAWVLAMLMLPTTWFAFRCTAIGHEASLLRNYSPVFYIHASLLLWLLIFANQPHKEERFLFPAYPLIALCAALTLNALERLWSYLTLSFVRNGHYRLVHNCQYTFVIGTLSVFMLLCLSRSAAVYRNYHAPLDVYMHANERMMQRVRHARAPVDELALCVGKEWYRYPGSFMLPDTTALNGTKVRLKFVKSEFRGLLPRPYDETLPSVVAMTRQIPETMNDANREEMDRYVDNVNTDCDFLIDLEVPDEFTTELEPNYASDTSRWERVYSERFLLARLSDRWSRAFYVPGFSWKKCTFTKYSLLERLR